LKHRPNLLPSDIRRFDLGGDRVLLGVRPRGPSDDADALDRVSKPKNLRERCRLDLKPAGRDVQANGMWWSWWFRSREMSFAVGIVATFLLSRRYFALE